MIQHVNELKNSKIQTFSIPSNADEADVTFYCFHPYSMLKTGCHRCVEGGSGLCRPPDSHEGPSLHSVDVDVAEDDNWQRRRTHNHDHPAEDSNDC
ncbi:hypothetical protein Hanom_Chr17g01583461 [Helianthus anomalus]